MGTKNDPGKYDCHTKAHPDEPMFTLLGRDPTAYHLVRIWTALSWGHFAMARVALDDAIAEISVRAAALQPEHKLLEALACSDRMKEWLERSTASSAGTAAGSPARIAENQTPKSESTGTSNAADAAA